jgi:protocatechuate 3,4-dioxygenase alpha subunit
MTAPYTPSQTPGPYFHVGMLDVFFRSSDQPGSAAVHLTGQVVDGDGAPVTDALLEIWQLASARAGEATIVRAVTDAGGEYELWTAKPHGGSGAGAAVDAPHLDVVLVAGGVQRHLVTRMYFPDEAAANAQDPVLSRVDPARRATLVAISRGAELRFDIRLQGPGETVFFDV